MPFLGPEGLEVAGTVLCETQWVPAWRVSLVCLCSGHGSVPLSQVLCLIPSQRETPGHRLPLWRGVLSTRVGGSLQRDALSAAEMVSEGPRKAASVPLSALHPQLRASSACVGVRGSGPATGRQNSWEEAGEEPLMAMSGHNSSLLRSRFLLLLL